MKGIVLAGGTGSRLRPLTYTMPKQMIPIGGKPVLEYAVTDLRDAGITDVGIVLGDEGHEEIKDHFGDGSAFDVNITYIYQGEPLGLGHAVGCAEDFVGEEPFVLYLGDDLLERGISDFVDQFDSEAYAGAVAVKRVDDPSRYGIVETDESGDIVGIVEKPSDPPSNLAGIGVFILTSAIFDEIHEIESSWRGEIELSDAMHRLLSHDRRLQRYVLDGWWYDVGTPEDVLGANRAVLDGLESQCRGTIEDGAVAEGRITMGEGSVVETGATIRGPVHIGDDVEVRAGSYIGPYTSVEDSCVVDGAAIESSVVLRETTVSATARIVDSIIGRSSAIADRSEDPDGVRLVTSSESQVGL